MRAYRKFLLPVAAIVLVATVDGACGGGGGSNLVGTAGPYHLVAIPEELVIAPSASQSIVFRLLDENDHPVPRQILQFAIFGPPETMGDAAKGATLSTAEAGTDGAGQVTLTILAGLETSFRLRATANLTVAIEVPVFVSAGLHGNADVAPTLAEAGGPQLASISLRLYDDQPCSSLDLSDPRNPPESLRPERIVDTNGSYVFTGLRIDQSHAVVGIGHKVDGTITYLGCLDLPGTTLLDDRTVRVFLPLFPVVKRAAGVFAVYSQWHFMPRPAPVATLVGAWTDLSKCPSDPAELWINCTLDALGGAASEADPLDCKPAADEGIVAMQISARRGVIANLPVSNIACHGLLDGQGRASVEALVAAGFPTPGPSATPSTVSLLPALASDLDGMFDSPRSLSEMEIETTDAAGENVLIHHKLSQLEFQVNDQLVREPLLVLGAPILDAWYVKGTATPTELVVRSHGFASRWGTAIRHAFLTHGLGDRGLPADEAAFVARLFDQFVVSDNGPAKKGCEALDQLLCGEAGLSAGCLGQACQTGTAALVDKLSAGFSAFDGDDIDFVLDGAAPLVDQDGNFEIERLGVTDGSPGVWSAELRTRSGTHPMVGSWVGARQPR